MLSSSADARRVKGQRLHQIWRQLEYSLASGERKHTNNGKLGASACYADFTLQRLQVETADAYRAQNDSVNPGSEVVEEALDCGNEKKYDSG